MNKMVQAAYDDSKAIIQWLEQDCKQRISLELFNEPDQQGVLIDGWISIRLCELEVKTIGRKETTDGLMVEVTVVQNNYPHEPDDVDVVEIASFHSVNSAVHKAFNLWFSNQLDHVLENIGITKMLAEDEEMMKFAKEIGGDS